MSLSFKNNKLVKESPKNKGLNSNEKIKQRGISKRNRKLRRFSPGTTQERKYNYNFRAKRESSKKLKEVVTRSLNQNKKASEKIYPKVPMVESPVVKTFAESPNLKVSRPPEPPPAPSPAVNTKSRSGKQAVFEENQRQANKSSQTSKSKVAAKKTVQTAVEKRALKSAEYQLPAGLEEYVSKSARPPLRKLNKFALLKVAPYAAAVVAGADILSARDKTGPTLGILAGGAGIALGRKFLRGGGGGLLGGTAGYAIGRLLGGALSSVHSPQIEGFGESGESSIGRKQLSDFGSGWVGTLGRSVTQSIGKKSKQAIGLANTLLDSAGGLSKTLDVSGVKKTFNIAEFAKVVPPTVVQSNLPKTISNLPKTISSLSPGSQTGHADRLVEEWNRKFRSPSSPVQLSGVIQNLQQEELRKQGRWQANLPTVKRSPFHVRNVSKKIAPSMEFSRSDVNEAILSYAKEKGIKPPSLGTGESTVARISTIGQAVKFTEAELSSSIGRLPTLSLEGQNRVQKASIVRTMSERPSQKPSLSQTANVKGRKAVRQQLPAAVPPVAPTIFDSIPVARGKTFIVSSLAEGNLGVEWSSSKIDSQISDIALSRPHGALYKAHNPLVVEAWKDDGSVAEARKKGFTGWGTGWDGARELGRLLGLTAKKGIARGKNYNIILNKLTPHLEKGEVIGSVGSGGLGSVDIMETTIGGKSFKYARKRYFEGPGQGTKQHAIEIADQEAAGLRAMRDSIAPTPYGRGRAVVDGKEQEYMFMELIEDALPAKEAVSAAGGFTKGQQSALKGAIEDLHSQGLSHSDIKLANMLVDKEGRLVLIDPMPGRYGDPQGFAGAIGRAQDIHALTLVQRNGKVSKTHRDLQISSNSLAYFQIGPNKGNVKYHAALPHVKDIFDIANVPEAIVDAVSGRSNSINEIRNVIGGVAGMKDFRPPSSQRAMDAYEQLRAERAMPKPEKVTIAGKRFNPPNGATRPTNMDLKVVQRQAAYEATVKSEGLHRMAVQNATVNNHGASTRHRSMAQSQSPFDGTTSPYRI